MATFDDSTSNGGDGGDGAPPKPKRGRSTKAQIEALEDAIITELKTFHPQSVRHIYYAMVARGLIAKTDEGYDKIIYHCTKLRLNGRVPYSSIDDLTREGEHVVTFDSMSDFLYQTRDVYRESPWKQADIYVEVWCESDSIAGVLRKVCKEFAVSLYSTRGFTSLSQPYYAAQNINGIRNVKENGWPVRIYYIGDFDPAGVLIDKDVKDKLRREKHLHPDVELDFIRLAITEEQIKQYKLPKMPRKKSDKRSLEVKWTVEAEALPAKVLSDLLYAELLSLLPNEALMEAKAIEKKMRKDIWNLAKGFDAEGN